MNARVESRGQMGKRIGRVPLGGEVAVLACIRYILAGYAPEGK